MTRKNRTLKYAALAALTFALGLAAGIAAAGKNNVQPSAYKGLSAEQAGANLLARALTEAEKGTWERLAVARVYQLSGQEERAQEIVEQLVAGKMEKADWLRLGRLYNEADRWNEAREAFDKALAKAPKDADLLAEVGAYYNLRGEREKAETYFEKAFALEDENFWGTVEAAGSYLGVVPAP